jgi:hypothetical protein
MALTGTPYWNKPEDIESIMKFLDIYPWQALPSTILNIQE